MKRLFALAVAASALTCGCMLPYKFPTADQPHATMKVRRVYERTAGARLDETCLIEGRSALDQSLAVGDLAEAPRSDAFLVQPRAARVEVKAAFSHEEMRTVQESYTVQVPYTSFQSYSCGFGQYAQTCSRMVTNYRSETRYRMVTKMVNVSDGECASALALAPAVDGVYLVDFTYRDKSVCSAVCVEQVSTGTDGAFQNHPCPRPTDDQMKALAEH